MTNSIKVIIYDIEGNIILNDSISSPIIGLQSGESFWYGSGNNKIWAKVISISYGIDTTSKCFVVEMIVEKSENKFTKTSNYTSIVDLGKAMITHEQPAYTSQDKRISIGASSVNKEGLVRNFSFAITTTSEFKTQKRESLENGDEIIIETNSSVISCILVASRLYGYDNLCWSAEFKLIEKIK